MSVGPACQGRGRRCGSSELTRRHDAWTLPATIQAGNVRMNHWVFAANPNTYRVVDAVRQVPTDWWTVGNSTVRSCDRVASWKYSGGDEHRGVVALAEVLSDPERRSEEDNPNWTDEGRMRLGKQQVPRSAGRSSPPVTSSFVHGSRDYPVRAFTPIKTWRSP